ncbi:hypothetical protein J7J26_02995 [Candidatus Micrarchaeota archaeon]|nr:hypothetical protein [Candidatus Micrarchaeota archaeon]
MTLKTIHRRYKETHFEYERNKDINRHLSPDKLNIVCKKAREEIINMITKAGSGHPGGSLSVVELLATLLNRDPNAKIILSKGHGGPALYALGKIMRFVDEDITLRKPFSKFQGHPEKNNPMVRFNTGALSTGLAASVGMAKSYLDDNPNNPEKVYVIVGDGEIQEGLAYEALSMAAQMKLKNLYVIVDNNRYQLEGNSKNINDALSRLIKAFKHEFMIARISNGHSIEEIEQKLDVLDSYEPGIGKSNIPKLIIANTIKGRGVNFMEDTHEWHGKVPKGEYKKRATRQVKFDGELPLIEPKITIEQEKVVDIILPPRQIYRESDGNIAPRAAHGERVRQITEANKGKVYCTVPDLAGSVGYSKIPSERLINTGIEEAISIGIAGGLAATGKLVFNAGFTKFNLTFGASTLSANDYNNLPVIYAFTHKGIATGGDGPSHQMLYADHIATAFPNMKVLVPGDANQVTAMIDWAIEANTPVCILMGRNKLPIIMKPYELTIEEKTEMERRLDEAKTRWERTHIIMDMQHACIGKYLPLYGKDYVYKPGSPDIVFETHINFPSYAPPEYIYRDGKSKMLWNLLLFSNGETLHETIDAAKDLRWNDSIKSIKVYNVSDITDVNISERLRDDIINANLICTIEDQNIGVGSHRRNSGVLKNIINDIVVELINEEDKERGKIIKNGMLIHHIGMDQAYGTTGTKRELYDIFGLSANKIKKRLERLLNENKTN